MKLFKIILGFLALVSFSLLFGNALSMFIPVDPLAISGGIVGLSLLGVQPKGVVLDGVYPEIWTGELITRFRSERTWVSLLTKRNELVKNNTIHLIDVGADPEVLINHNTYPISVVTRDDGDIAIGLDKFDTVNTAVTDDELQGIGYDKIGVTLELHKAALEETTQTKGIHALTPLSNSADTPVIETTGASNGETQARKRATPADFIRMKKKLDDLKVPKKGRICVLCNDHVADLLSVDENFQKQYKDIQEGKVLRLYGFDIYEEVNMPYFKVTDNVLTKKAFGAAADATNDQAASTFFLPSRAFAATGDVKMFYSEAAKDPTMRRNIVGFKLYDIMLPKKWTGFGALVSAKVS
jgi:hypothetical protein